MADLIKELQERAGITEDQAVKTLYVLKEYVESKVPPMMRGMVDKLLGDAFKNVPKPSEEKKSPGQPIANKAEELKAQTSAKLDSLADEAKEDVEEFVKDASEKINEWASKAEEAAQDAINKLKNIMEEGSNK